MASVREDRSEEREEGGDSDGGDREADRGSHGDAKARALEALRKIAATQAEQLETPPEDEMESLTAENAHYAADLVLLELIADDDVRMAWDLVSK